MKYSKKRALFVLILLAVVFTVAALLLPMAAAPLIAERGQFLLTNVDVIDIEQGGIEEDQNVYLSQGKIDRIEAASDLIQEGGNYTVIDASDKFLLPGLWDMHTHSLKLSPQLHHPLLIRYGVTSIRDMSGCLDRDDAYWACPEDRRRWQEEALLGERVAPRYPLQSSYQTNGGNEVPSSFADYFRLRNAEDAKRFVDFYANQNVDFIKTYSELTREQFDHLQTAARQQRMSLAGHKPLVVPLSEALDAGMQSIEHGRLFAFECYRGIDDFRQLDNPIAHYDASFIRKIVEQQEQGKCQELMHTMSLADITWVPTLTTLKMSAESRNQSFRNDPRLEFIATIFKKLIWQGDIERAATKGFDQHDKFVHQDFYQLAADQVKAAHQAKIPILVGTDNIDTYVFSGSSVHDEMRYLVDAGLTPLEALQSATILPARFAKLDEHSGSVTAGKNSDLVLLNANPLDEINNSKDIAAVFFDDQYYDQQALEELEDYTRAMAASLRLNAKLLADLLLSPLMRRQLAD